ncbi:MAG TPA: hypothetical protein VM076_06645 [Gemmatimonadaceae bacterium]|nr:hypothetical protein [Gemmatimonadaceae bacterium]
MTRPLRAPRAVFALVVLGAHAAACDAGVRASRGHAADATTAYAVQRLALDTLFNGAEHHERLVLWSTDAGDGPVLAALGPAVVRPGNPRVIDISKLTPSLPARVMTEGELGTLFRNNPDAWAAFFRENPGAAGLVEVSGVQLSADNERAVTYVGRSCGEHCRNVWRLVARRRPDGGWAVDTLRWIPVRGA